MPTVDPYLARLRDPDPRVQDSTCEELADLLDAAVFDAGVPGLLAALVERAAHAELPLVREAALNALGSGLVAYPALAPDLDLTPLVRRLEHLEAGTLVQAMFVLGNARQASLRSAIEPYLDHAHPDLSLSAADALADLNANLDAPT